MGKLVSKSRNKKMRIIMLGLDGAGKTTILYYFKLDKLVQNIPNNILNYETVTYENVKCYFWDITGRELSRPQWRHYYAGTDALIFVIDSADPDRFNEAKNQLAKLLQVPELQNAVVLIIANKQDLANAKKSEEIKSYLEAQIGELLMKINKWVVQGASAKTGKGLNEGLEWLTGNYKSK